MSRELARVLAGQLHAAGADTIFGVPGGGASLDLIGAGEELGMRFVLGHGETAACVTASTYGLLKRAPGVCTVTRGPGAASAVNGVAQATLDRAPLVLVSETVPRTTADRVVHQRLDQVRMLAPASKWSGTLGGDERAPALAAAAVTLAGAAPPGAVSIVFDPTAPSDAPPRIPGPAPEDDDRQLDRAVELAARARRPIFVLGTAAMPWANEVRSLLRTAACPVLTTYQAKGLVSDDWEVTGPLFTNGAIERALMDRADLIVTVGLDTVEPLPSPWNFRAPTVALSPWPTTDGYIDASVAVVGALDHSLTTLLDALRSDWDPAAGAKARQEALRLLHAPPGPDGGLSPHEVVAAVHDARAANAIATVDAGAHMLVAMPLWRAEHPHDVLISNGLATMGFAVPAAIGAALAHPDRPVVCFIGDGGLGMTLAELETIARLQLDITVVVFNDRSLSLIKIKQGEGQGGRHAVDYGPTDFAAVARGLGLAAHRARSRGELETTLQRDQRGPRLIDVRVDASVYPHVMAVSRG